VTKLDLALRDLHDAEQELLLSLERLGQRHAADHEVVHVTRDLARWSERHLEAIAGVGPRFGVELSPEARHTNGLVAAARRRTSDALGRHHEPALALMDDLRDLYGAAARVVVDWEVLAQAGKAVKDEELVDLAQRCRSETERQATWAEAKLKESAAQALVTQ
jgi:ferritin-like metal-binding protein YciE